MIRYLLILLLLVSKSVVAQNDQDTLAYQSPYDFSLKKELPFIVAGLGLFGSSFIVANNNNTSPFTIEELNALDRNDVNKFDRNSTYNKSPNAVKKSNYATLSSMALPILLIGNKQTRSDLLNLIVIGLEVGTISRGLNVITKHTVNRARPYTYNNQFSYEERTDENSQLSFFSGHTTVATTYSFFFAKVITDYHPNMKKGYKIGIWSLATLLPASTAYYRVKGGQHYPTDVITGYAVGAIVGWLVPELHKKRKGCKPAFSLLPYNYNNYSGLSLTCKL